VSLDQIQIRRDSRVPCNTERKTDRRITHIDDRVPTPTISLLRLLYLLTCLYVLMPSCSPNIFQLLITASFKVRTVQACCGKPITVYI
jgi:hypothetical protein